MKNLFSKNLLVIMPKFYGYENIIQKYLEKKFKKVHIIYENRDWVSFWHRFVYVYLPNQKRKILDDFFIKEINKSSENIDAVFVIRGSSLSPLIMEYMKEKYPSSCKYVMYQWDGINNNKNVINIAQYFDSVYTFDIQDASKYGWKYRPLFYINNLVNTSERDIDISFLCSLHSQRAEIMSKLKDICAINNYKFYSHMYCNRFAYYKWKYIGKKEEYKDTNNSDVVFKSLSLEDTYKVYGRSKVIVDYTHPSQTGFTMRTIESIGNKCKLITNNKYIKDADFYNPNNIYVYNRTNINIPNSFMESKYEDIDPDLYLYYSLDGWINTLAGDL